jgi:VCBS repeat protein
MQKRTLITILSFTFLLVFNSYADTNIGAPNDPTIGGGKIYLDTYSEKKITTGNYIVNDIASLRNALSNVSPNQIIFIPGNITLDLTNESSPLLVPQGVTLASDRGVNGSKGALLKTTTYHNFPLIEIMGDNVRLTGFRSQGSNALLNAVLYGGQAAQGIISVGNENIEVDNMELFNWSKAAIRFGADSVNARVHHSSIHDNPHISMGYGVVLYGNANVVIDHNLFGANRHSIAGDGAPGQIYEAHSNIILSGNSHAFDVHGYFETGGASNDPSAGEQFSIHHNTFLLGSQAITIRGIPTVGISIMNNKFAHANEAEALSQYVLGTISSTYQGNFVISDNLYSHHGDMRYADFEPGNDLLQTISNDLFWAAPNPPEANGNIIKNWYISYNGIEPWKKLLSSGLALEDMVLKDFNGDGVADVFNAAWEQWKISSGGVNYWELLNTSGASMSMLSFSDLDGNGITDVMIMNWGTVSWDGVSSWDFDYLDSNLGNADQLFFTDIGHDHQSDIIRSTGNSFEVSWGGATPFEPLGHHAFRHSGHGYGDFNGDGKTDKFIISGDSWIVEYNDGSTQTLSSGHSESLDELVFGDFNGDGKSDVFRINGIQWQYSSAGIGTWINLKSSGTPLADMAFGDFNGDGITDIFIKDQAGNWRVSWGGATSWITVGNSGADFSRMIFTDINHDGRTDVVYSDNSIIQVSLGGTERWRYWTPDMSH